MAHQMTMNPGLIHVPRIIPGVGEVGAFQTPLWAATASALGGTRDPSLSDAIMLGIPTATAAGMSPFIDPFEAAEIAAASSAAQADAVAGQPRTQLRRRSFEMDEADRSLAAAASEIPAGEVHRALGSLLMIAASGGPSLAAATGQPNVGVGTESSAALHDDTASQLDKQQQTMMSASEPPPPSLEPPLRPRPYGVWSDDRHLSREEGEDLLNQVYETLYGTEQ